MSSTPVITPEIAYDLRRMNRREASESALRIILHDLDNREPLYTMAEYEKLADQIFNWLEEVK